MQDDRSEYFKLYRHRRWAEQHPNTDNHHPEDTGCSRYSRCLTCPYPTCQEHERSRKPPVFKRAVQTPAPATKHPIPTSCPRCLSLVARDGYPDEVFCYACGSTLLPWMPLPAGWVEPRYYSPSMWR